MLFISQVTDEAPGQRQIAKKMLVYLTSHHSTISVWERTALGGNVVHGSQVLTEFGLFEDKS